MSDALARYRMAERQDKDALQRYKGAGAESDTLGALAKYLGLRAYWDRQGRMASQGLQMAEEGAQAVRGGDLSGLGGMILGPLGYFSSPVNALFPERSEIDAATDVPNWSKPLIAGGLETMAIMAPGPKTRGLGKGMAQLADDATDAERAALAGRLETEAAQTGGAASNVGRDQALRNLTEAGPIGTKPSITISKNGPRYEVHSGDKFVGSAGVVDEHSSPFVSVVNLEKEFRKQGIAKKLYDFIEKDLGKKLIPSPLGLSPDAVSFWQKRLSKLPPAQREAILDEAFGIGKSYGTRDDIARSILAPLRAQPAPTPQPEGILAYHGSPHTFDKFDMSKIGTGEGAQAYGHGLYFAEAEDVAKTYKFAHQPAYAGSAPALHAAQALKSAHRAGLSGDEANRAAKQYLHEYAMSPGNGYRRQEFFDAMNNFDELTGSGGVGSLYQVRINAKPDEFLDWDRPLSEQPERIRKAAPIAKLLEEERAYKERYPSGGLGERLGANVLTTAKEAQLKAAGIKGIRYKDAGSRGGDGGTYNYVVFDDKIIDILKRYGIPMTAGVGGAVVISGQNMPPDLAAQMGPQG